MPAHQPVWWSWPCIRHAEQERDTIEASSEHGEHLTHQQLAAWVGALIVEDGQLSVTADSLRLLPQQLPYELLGALVLAAADAYASAQHVHGKQILQQLSEQQAHVQFSNAQLQQQQQIQGLRLASIDLQEPVTRPLQTCLTAYTNIQQLSLNELNIDVSAAAALGSHLQTASGCHLHSFILDGVFMCELAWAALAEGMAAGCDLQALRLHQCLTVSSLMLLAAAIPAGCQLLKELDLSTNVIGMSPSCHSWHEIASADSDAVSAADNAWAQLLQGLPQGCKQLQSLSLSHCSLGVKSAAKLAKMLRAQGLRQLNLAGSTGMGQVLSQVASAASCCTSLQQLDLSATGLTDASLKSLTSANWLSGIPGLAARTAGLQQLRVCSNMLSGSAVGQLIARQLVSGALSGLKVLSLAGCPSVGDQGTLALAAVLGRCSLTCLDLSGCEVTDTGADALAAFLGSDAPEGTMSKSERGHIGARLEKLRLADNQMKSAGIQSLAAAISSPHCRLRLLDVSFNWVGPQAMQPLVAAAAHRNATADVPEGASQQQQQQPHLLVLRECLTEYWRVEAAKTAATTPAPEKAAVMLYSDEADAGGAAAAAQNAAPSLADSSSCHTCHSCCSLAGSSNTCCDGLVCSSTAAAEPIAMGTGESVSDHGKQCGGAVWTYNSLYCNEAGGLFRASSGIAAGVDAYSDMCRIYTDSDCLSDISVCSALDNEVSSMGPVKQPSSSSSPANNSANTESPCMALAEASLGSVQCRDEWASLCPSTESSASTAAAVSTSTALGEEASAADSIYSIDVGDRSRQESFTGVVSGKLREQLQQCLRGINTSNALLLHTHNQQLWNDGRHDIQAEQQSAVSDQDADAALRRSSSAISSPCKSPMQSITAARPQCSATTSSPTQHVAGHGSGMTAVGATVGSRLAPKPPPARSTSYRSPGAGAIAIGGSPVRATSAAPAPGLKTLRSMRQRVSPGKPSQNLACALSPSPSPVMAGQLPTCLCRASPNSTQLKVTERSSTSLAFSVGPQQQVKAVARASSSGLYAIKSLDHSMAGVSQAVLSAEASDVGAKDDRLMEGRCTRKESAVLPTVAG